LHRLPSAVDVDDRQSRMAEQGIAMRKSFTRVGPARFQGGQSHPEIGPKIIA
jgi:hypothetical protein